MEQPELNNTQDFDPNDSSHDDQRLELLPYEQDIMLDTFADDVLFIMARGLGLERFILNHLHLYSDPQLLVLVINSDEADDHYFLKRLTELNTDCPPKVVNSDVLTKDRETIYLEGGIQFVTSRILMVDLLTDRIPVNNIAGIVVLHAEKILTTYQESFILRLFRERKKGGFVKAFTDNPIRITSGGLGQLQRLMDKLYIKRIRIVPRFDVDVKRSYDRQPATLTEINLDLPLSWRKVRSGLVDIIRTCVKELKQCTQGVDILIEDESLAPSAGLRPSLLEMELRSKSIFLIDKQERILNDLKILRGLLQKVEDLDPYSIYQHLNKLRNDKEYMSKNSGWLFTSTASKVFSAIECLCNSQDEKGNMVVSSPPKWDGLKCALDEIQMLLRSDPSATVITSNNDCCRQLIDVVKFGGDQFGWMQAKSDHDKSMGPEPGTQPYWNPANIRSYKSKSDVDQKKDLLDQLQENQKKILKESKKRRANEKPDSSTLKQAKLVNFGIVRYSEKKTANKDYQQASNEDSPQTSLPVTEKSSASGQPSSPLIFMTHYDRYSLVNALDELRPNFIILYHIDIVAMRLIETFKANNPDHSLRIYNIMYKESNEEERYLLSIRREQSALESLIREQGVLMIPTEYDISRESTSQLRRIALQKDSRKNVALPSEEAVSKIIVDMREFNSELPTVLYKRGIDLVAATLEVGDYVLSPNVCVERKALDDLTQSLNSGRVFKQVEQMLRHYENTILLIESAEKFRNKLVNGGPFQGELSKRSKEIRSLLTMLVRGNPRLRIIWSVSPKNSAELFEEIKLDQANPDADAAMAIRWDDLGDRSSTQPAPSTDEAGKKKSRKANNIIKRQMASIPNLGSGDIEKLMLSGKFENMHELVNADSETISSANGDNIPQAESLVDFFRLDFRMMRGL
uniref:DNA repair endonuclease XPF n=1 Tax=Acrobeloides nanus TaxID=290746 RepID=A0A914CEA7_9BILA